MDIFAELDWRGLVHQTPEPQNLRQWLSEGSQIVYAGFDPTSDGLHVGNFVPLMMLRRFQKAGHHPIVLAGGATGMIGDATGMRGDATGMIGEVGALWVHILLGPLLKSH